MGDRHVVAAPKKVDPEADKLLRQMSDYLAGLQSFSVQNFAVDETAMKSGEKIQATSDLEITVQRPNHMKSTQRGAGEGLALWYDGKTMTIACKSNNSFESVAAPRQLDGAIDKMRKYFKVDAPGADLLYTNPYNILMEQVVSGRVIGRETVQGVPTNHVAFQGEDVDFQLWIQGGQPAAPAALRDHHQDGEVEPPVHRAAHELEYAAEAHRPGVRVPRASGRQARHIGHVVVCRRYALTAKEITCVRKRSDSS